MEPCQLKRSSIFRVRIRRCRTNDIIRVIMKCDLVFEFNLLELRSSNATTNKMWTYSTHANYHMRTQLGLRGSGCSHTKCVGPVSKKGGKSPPLIGGKPCFFG